MLFKRPTERVPPPPKLFLPSKVEEPGLEYFLVNLSPEVLEELSNQKLGRLLHKYRQRKLKWEKRKESVSYKKKIYLL